MTTTTGQETYNNYFCQYCGAKVEEIDDVELPYYEIACPKCGFVYARIEKRIAY
jgi:DNA-directed RNA polymerase subunit RPC12/RpoP